MASLRVRLLLLVFLAVLPALGLVFYTGVEQRRSAARQAQDEALRLARWAADEQQHEILVARQLLTILAQLPQIQRGDADACHALFADLLKQYPQYVNLVASAPDGNVVCSGLPLAQPTNFADRAWFQRAVQTRDFVVGEYAIGRITGRAVLIFAYPVLDFPTGWGGGRPVPESAPLIPQSSAEHAPYSLTPPKVGGAGGPVPTSVPLPLHSPASGEASGVRVVLSIALDLNWLNQLVARAQLPPGSTLTLRDRNGTILARYPDPELWVGKTLPEAPTIQSIVAQQGEGTAEATGVDGIVRLYAFTGLGRDPEAGAYVSVGIPVAVAFAEADRMLARNVAGLGIVAALALAAAWFGGTVFLLRPIDGLVRAAQRLAAGELGARSELSYGPGEFGQLARTFDEMAGALQQHEAELRRANRTLKTLRACNQALVRATDESGLLHAVCQIMVEIGGYRLAWVGFAEQDAAKTVRPVAQAGYEEGYLETLNITWADTEQGRGPTGTAIRTGHPVIAKSILTDPAFAPWRTEAIKRGYASSIALPLVADGQPLGALNIYAQEVDAFDTEEVGLLMELADDLAYGLTALRTRAQREQAMEEITCLFDEAHRRLNHVQALRIIDLAIRSSVDLPVTLKVILDQVIAQLHVDAADVLLLNSDTQILEYAAGRGFRTSALQHTRLKLGEGYAGQAALERRLLQVPDLTDAMNGLGRAPQLPDEAFIAYYGVPLIAKGQVKGVLEVFHRASLAPDPEWLNFLEALAAQAAIAIDNATLLSSLQHSNAELILAYDSTLEGWSRALDLRDRETEGHTQRVTEMTLRLARVMGFSEEEQVHIRRGALLHDIGKMGIPDSILLKPGPLADEEWEIMRKHPVYAYEMLAPIAYLHPALDIPYCHHEKWDGTGYPRGLKGEQIPLTARIFAVVDVYDALHSDRPYRPAWPGERIVQYIREQAGKHFDPQVVQMFLETIVERG